MARSTEATHMTWAPLQPKSGVPHCSPSVSLWGGGVPSPTRKPHGPGHTGQCSGWSLLPSGPPPPPCACGTATRGPGAEGGGSISATPPPRPPTQGSFGGGGAEGGGTPGGAALLKGALPPPLPSAPSLPPLPTPPLRDATRCPSRHRTDNQNERLFRDNQPPFRRGGWEYSG